MQRHHHDLGGVGAAARERRSLWRLANVLFGILLLAALLLVVTHLGEERRFAVLLTQIAPAWLLVALGYQAGTYLCAAAVWHRVLRRVGLPLRLRSLVPLGFAKLFVDQVAPSAGVGGTLLVVRGLMRRGVPQGFATAALLVDLLSFYTAHTLVVVLALVILWTYHDLHLAILLLATFFAAVAVVIPLTILWLNQRGDHTVPLWIRRRPGMERLLTSMAEVPAAVLRDPVLLLQDTALQLAIFVLDAATLDVMLRALGYPTHPAAVFASFTMASVVA